MTFPTAPETDILRGFAQFLADSAIGLTWRPDGSSYTADEVPIVLMTMRETPDMQIVLNWVPLDDDPDIPQGAGTLQVAGRGLPNQASSVNDLLGAVYRVLHGSTSMQFGQAFVVQCLRQNAVPMGQDAAVRNERADHYRVDVEYPPTVNRPI